MKKSKIFQDAFSDVLKPHGSATQATALSFSSGLNYGLGVDVYSRPVQLFEW